MALIFCLRPVFWAPYIAGTPSGNACLGSGFSSGNAESLTDSMGVRSGTNTHTHTQAERGWTPFFFLLPSRAHHRRIERRRDKGKKMAKQRWWRERSRRAVFTSHFFREACGLLCGAQGGFLMKAQEGAAAGGMCLSREDKTPCAWFASPPPFLAFLIS